MIRVTLLWLIVLVLSAYAWRDWFKSLCGLILLMAIIEHPDIPKSIGGIQGLNPWNVLLLSTASAWLIQRGKQGLRWDMPKHMTLLLFVYLGVVVVGFMRLIADRDNIFLAEYGETIASLTSEHMVNTLKWVIPGLMLFDACRTRQRMKWGMAAVLGIYVLLALQLARWMPPSTAVSGAALTHTSRKIIQNEIGYHAVNMSMILSGASWAVLAMTPLFRKNWQKLVVLGLFLLIAYGQAVTAGRMGYVTWAVIGLLLCVLRWRRLLLFVPLVPIAVTMCLPGVAERLMEGFGDSESIVETSVDDYAVTSGRTLIWPFVTDKIEEAPIVGYGRRAMTRTGLEKMLWEQMGEEFPHPHNAYLELLLDNGIVGFIPVTLFYAFVVIYAVRLFLDKRDPLFGAIGGMTCALVFALLIAAMGSQTFYPREGAVGMWCAIGMMLRVHISRKGMSATRVQPVRSAQAAVFQKASVAAPAIGGASR
ncbi:MAG: O-antigen ligase family protein [Planctomycetes bacterium]|nr:O-antigen ligase family protein [Planctomycetota bacterium]